MKITEKRHRAAHALKSLGFKQKDIVRVLKLSQPTISHYLKFETYQEMNNENKARTEALEQKKKRSFITAPFKRWFQSI